MNAIEIKNLSKNFGPKQAVCGLDMTVPMGAIYGFIGENGSGKSTLLRCINRLETATSGEIVVDGFHISDKKIDINKVRENIGMVFQHFNLFPHLTVLENITLAPVTLKLKTKEHLIFYLQH